MFFILGGKKVAENFANLTAAIQKLQADVATLVAQNQANNQAQIDAATAAVQAIDSTVTAATTPPAPTA